MQQNYSFYLFSKLFDHFNTIEIEYDILFEEVEQAYNEYDLSKFNNPNKGEYECMVDFLTEYRPKLLIN